jgi:hypothetical protein
VENGVLIISVPQSSVSSSEEAQRSLLVSSLSIPLPIFRSSISLPPGCHRARGGQHWRRVARDASCGP